MIILKISFLLKHKIHREQLDEFPQREHTHVTSTQLKQQHIVSPSKKPLTIPSSYSILSMITTILTSNTTD